MNEEAEKYFKRIFEEGIKYQKAQVTAEMVFERIEKCLLSSDRTECLKELQEIFK